MHLKGYGFILVFRIDAPDGNTEYWATRRLERTPAQGAAQAGQIWTIETYHRGLKQYCGVEHCQGRSARTQRNDIGWAIQAFVRLEYHRLRTGSSWFTTKLDIIRPAHRQYLTQPSPILYGFVQYSATHSRATA